MLTVRFDVISARLFKRQDKRSMSMAVQPDSFLNEHSESLALFGLFERHQNRKQSKASQVSQENFYSNP